MARLDAVADEQTIKTPQGTYTIPLAHPSEVRNRKSTSKPLIDLGLPPDTQQEVLDRISSALAADDDTSAGPGDAGPDEEGDEEEDDTDVEFDAEVDPVLAAQTQSSGPTSTKEAFWDEFFDSLILTVPFTFLYILLDILVHLQYQHRPTIGLVASHVARAAPTLGILVFYTNRHAAHPVTIWFLTSASILSGARLIWLVNKAGWSLTTDQAPPMGTLWIFTIVQLPLSRAIIALVVVAGYTYHAGLKIKP